MNINKSLVVKEIEQTKTYQKVIFSSGIYKYIYYNKDIENIKLKVGDIYNIKGIVIKQQEANVPNGFNYNKYLKYQNIIGIIDVQNISYEKNIFVLSKIKYLLGQYFDKRLKNSDIIKALVIGDKTGINDQSMNNIQMIGISHLFVVSGLHVGMITSALNFLINKTKISIKTKNIVIYMFLFFYLILTNFMVSVLRVTIGYLLKNVLKKDFTQLDKIAINILVVLLINPFYIFSYSFILTYLISSTIIIISPFLKKNRGIISYIINMLIISLASIIITLPIVVHINPSINLLSLLYNVIYIPAVSYLLLPLSIILSFLPFLEPLVGFVYYFFNGSITFLSQFDMFVLTCPILSNFGVVCYYIVLIIVAYMIEVKKSYFIFLFFIYLFCWYNKAYIEVFDKVVFLDVAEGDATHIKTRFNKCNIIIDTGVDKDDTLITYLKNQGIRTIDLVIISHGDNDHNGNLGKLINEFKIKKIILSYFDYNTYQILVNYKYQNYMLVKKGDKFKIDGIWFDIIWPISDTLNVNNNSLVFTMNYDNTVYLFTGDIEKEVEEKIIDVEKEINVDVLKIAHHGSNTSTHKKWLENVKFNVGVAMTGDKNTFGFPNKYTVERLKNKEIYYTSECDTITFSKIFFKKKWRIHLQRDK